MYKRITAVIVCIMFVLTMIPEIPSFAVTEDKTPAEEPAVKMMSEDREVTEVDVYRDMTAKVKAETDIQYEKIRWQILEDEAAGKWIDIDRMDRAEIELTYTMTQPAADEAGKAYVRCVLGEGEGEISSEKLTVNVGEFSPQHEEEASPAVQIQADGQDPKAVTGDYVSVTVVYLDEKGQQIFNPYKAQVEKGRDFSQEVSIPDYLGFGAFMNKADPTLADPAAADDLVSRVSINEKNILTDRTYHVYYKPVDVPYGARYYFQNIHDDGYTERTDRFYTGKAKTGTIIEDKVLADHAGDTTGFTALYHYPESVAADGSTVFQSYYDRNYYFIKFDMDGGYGTEPIYGRYESPVVAATPSKAGYTFAGWDRLTEDSDGDGIPDRGDGKAESSLIQTVPDYNVFYRALWKKDRTVATFIYWKENPDDDGYSYWSSKRVKDIEPGTVLSGKDDINIADAASGYTPDKVSVSDEYRFFTYNDAKTEKNVTVKGDGSTVINVYYTRNVYTLRFFYGCAKPDGSDAWVCKNTNEFSEPSRNTIAIDRLLDTGRGTWNRCDYVPVLKNTKYIKDRGKLLKDGYEYHYFTIEGKYDSILAGPDEKWPLDVLEPVKCTRMFGQTFYGYFGAWASEGQSAYAHNNSNRTVKGKYARLDKQLLLWDAAKEKQRGERVVNYLAFWTNMELQNGTNTMWQYNVCVPPLDGKTIPADRMVTVKGKQYELLDSFRTFDTNEDYSQQTPPPLEGFTYDNAASEAGVLPGRSPEGFVQHFGNMVYKRNDYDLRFYNYNYEMKDMAQSVPYNTYMTKYEIKDPPYPKGLQEGAYEFTGWYTSPECVEGTEYDFTKEQMPASSLVLYAKWAPKKHKVHFFRTYDELVEYQQPGDFKPLIYHVGEVEHGKVLGPVKAPDPVVENGVEYKFSGWFYMDHGKKMSYVPSDIPVMKDMDVFAEWGSMTAQPYDISYVLKDDRKTKVADDNKGFAYQGSTRTFTPKGGPELYEQYRQGYFPTLASHSITMEHEDDKEAPVKNIHTFEYVHATNVEYTVRFVDRTTGVSLKPDRKLTTDNGVVTERFETVQGYVPDAFYKRLVLAVVPDGNGGYTGSPDNVITFYYTKSDSSAVYAVHHMMQKPGTLGTDMKTDGTGDYKEDGFITEGVGSTGAVSVTPIAYTGFTPVKQAREVRPPATEKIVEQDASGNYTIDISPEGTELYIFYKRNLYSYDVEYREWGTETELAPKKTVNDVEFASTVTERPVTVDGFTPIDEDGVQQLTVSARQEQNRIVFYYTTLKYTVEYKAVGSGSLTKPGETVEGDAVFTGSVPVPEDGYEFEGWYTDRECTSPVTSINGEIDPSDMKFTPYINTNMRPSPAENIFYAKFIKMTGDLTIERSGAEADETFVYRITGPEGTMEATSKGNDPVVIKDLMRGSYSVVCENDGWSWRHGADEAVSAQVTENGGKASFSGGITNGKWLNGYSLPVINQKEGMVRYLE